MVLGIRPVYRIDLMHSLHLMAVHRRSRPLQRDEFLKIRFFAKGLSMFHATSDLTVVFGIVMYAASMVGFEHLASDASRSNKQPAPLETRRVNQIDNYHGIDVADPYRWLEDDIRESKEVADWVAAQNEQTFAFLNAIPQRELVRRRLTELWNYERYGAPFRRGDDYYFYKNDGLQNQSVLYRQKSLDAELELFLDPNDWSKDGTVALSGISFSDDGQFMAYSRSKAGSDWRTWRVMNVETSTDLKDEIHWTKFGSVSWMKDGSGFFYGRFEEPKEGEEFQDVNLNHRVYFHKLGSPQSEDQLIYARPDHPTWGFDPKVTEDGRYLVISTWKGTDDKYRISYLDLKTFDDKTSDPPLIDLIDNFDNEYTLVGNEGAKLFFLTDVNAPRKRLIAIDLEKPEQPNWQELIPQRVHVLTGVSDVGGLFIAKYLKDASTEVRVHDRDGKFLREVSLPGIGSASGFGGREDAVETFYTFSSFATPSRIFRYDLKTGESRLLREAQVDFDPDAFEVEQVFYTSKDGTRVPMFLAYKKGLQRDGNTPTLLYGYGGFSVSLTPGFSVSRLMWMEMGGLFAMPNLRGGGEYGEEWHRAGTRLNKQNVFDDFIAAAEWLIESKYTRTEKLAIQGGSNGGLLVGACMTQRPDLFGACLPAVGVMDMLRFHKFTAGRYWVDDYGSAENPEEFQALLAYSPYHNLKSGVSYPPTLVTTADTDDRVVPGHSFKFAARLQEVHKGNNPVLIRVETKAGHGAGKPTGKLIATVADQWAFLMKVLDMHVTFGSGEETQRQQGTQQ